MKHLGHSSWMYEHSDSDHGDPSCHPLDNLLDDVIFGKKALLNILFTHFVMFGIVVCHCKSLLQCDAISQK